MEAGSILIFKLGYLSYNIFMIVLQCPPINMDIAKAIEKLKPSGIYKFVATLVPPHARHLRISPEILAPYMQKWLLD